MTGGNASAQLVTSWQAGAEGDVGTALVRRCQRSARTAGHGGNGQRSTDGHEGSQDERENANGFGGECSRPEA